MRKFMYIQIREKFQCQNSSLSNKNPIKFEGMFFVGQRVAACWGA